MDSFDNFLDIFQRAISERNSQNLTEILRGGRRYLQSIAKDEIELALSKLFDSEFGLLRFIQREFKRAIPQKGFDMAIKEAFCFIEFILEQFSEIYEPYVEDTQLTCQMALTTKCSILIQKAACSTFRRLIYLFNKSHMNLSNTVQKFVSTFHHVDVKRRSLRFSVLTCIAKNVHDPEIKKYLVIIFHQLRNDFIKQYKLDTLSHSIDTFQVYLDAFSEILGELPREVVEEQREQLYMWVKELGDPKKYSVKKVSMRAAVNLLSSHIKLFDEFIYHDYNYWYDLLVNLAQDKNVACSECGQRALKYYYQTIGLTLKNKSSEDDKAIFLYFKNLFEKQLKSSHDINSNMLPFIVYGFSQMAAPCKRYLTNEDVKNMFSLIANCAMPLCSRDDLDKKNLEYVGVYQAALSEIILHTSDLSIDQIHIITKLSILLIKRFPDLPIVRQNEAIDSLINTIINVGIVSKSLVEEFLYNLIYNGVVWTSSHTLLVDAELQLELKNLTERPLCYKDYLPLWTKLVKVYNYKQHGQTGQYVIDSIIHIGLVLIEKLNLNTKAKKDNVFSDVAYSQIAENEADFRTFVNIIDLYVEIINKLESPLFVNTIDTFLLKVISKSYKHHLVSGFYKLVHATFQHISNLSKDEIEVETLELLYKYLSSVLTLIPTFSNELLTTSLYLILDIPTMCIERILSDAIPSFKIAFTIGISDFELAHNTLTALERWIQHLTKQNTNNFLLEIVPFLEPYLQSGESSVELLQDIIKSERKVIKRIVLKDDETTLEKFQMKVLLFIATLDSDVINHFIYKRSMDIGSTWDKKDLLKYSLTFSDKQVDIHFDKILSRIILLAENSGDRQTKITACEVLHAIVAFILGKTSQQLTSNPDRFVPIYIKLCPALLNLGCDYDETVRKMFQPLVLQLTHWLSSKFMLKSPATIHFVDSLFKGLSNDSNLSLRDFAGMCLAEFAKWSIKQSDDEKISQLNIYEVIYKMTNFALHPSSSKRIAAATSFNHLYTILREDEKIVSIYWLEILYSFVKSLDGCNDPSIITALDHVERVLIAKKNLLNAEHHSRRKPDEFEGSTLRDAVNWLLTQCGCMDQCCRARCMDLVIKLSEHVANCDSVKTLMKDYIDTHGIERFNFIILNELKLKVESVSSKGILPLLRSLDCYIWLMKGNLMDIEYLLGNSNMQKDLIFDCLSNFVCVINNIKIEDTKEDFILLSKELEDLQTLQCKTVLAAFHFLQILLDSNLQGVSLPDSVFNKDFYELITKCIMCPQMIGFNAKNLEITEALPTIMGNLLQSILTRRTDSPLIDLIKFDLSLYVDKHAHDFFNLEEIISCTDSCGKLKQYVRGLCFLEQYNILERLSSNAKSLLHQLKDKVKRIFKILAKECVGELICVNIKPSAKEYLKILMDFLLMHYKSSMTKMLLELIQDDTALGLDSNKIEHGLYFLNMFKDEIFRYMLKDGEKTMEIFTDVIQTNPSRILIVIEQLFLFVQRHKKKMQDHIEILANSSIKKFAMFEGAVNVSEEKKQKLISIFAIAVHLKRMPIDVLSLNKDLYVWILTQLMKNPDIEYKIHILDSFLVCLVDMTSETRPELLAILRSLKDYRFELTPHDFSQKTVKALKTINCFQKLATLLPVTKSNTIFETIISFAAGIAEYVCNEKTDEYLQKYFTSIPNDYVLESIQSAYKLFMNTNTQVNDRFDVLHKFLLSSFEFCKTSQVRGFFERNIKEIHAIICQSFVGNSSDTKQLIISKIGCYHLIAVMFAKIHMRDIDGPESVITQNAVDNVNTGKELLQSLYGNTLNVRKLKTPEPELKELMRLLHCAAYNCSIAIVSSLKKDEDSYVSIFAENRQKEQLIWENIIDCQKKYDFKQTVDEYPKYRKKLINIRKSMKQRQSSKPYSYIYSYDLSTSTLTEDINAYDFNETTVRDKSDDANKEERMSLTFESDELNNHECMASICGVLNHIVTEKICITPVEDDDITIPKWLKCFLSSLSSTRYDNVRLFMIKVILNMQTVFQSYAKFVRKPLMDSTYFYLKGNQLNYIIVDIIEMLIDWQVSSVRKSKDFMSNEDQVALQRLWTIIIQKVIVKRTNEITKAIYRYNMNMVKTMLEVWRSYLKLPENLSDKMRTAPGVAVYLILICLCNGMDKDIFQNNDILEFLKKLLENWQNDEETVLQCCECLGLILKHMDNDEALANNKCAVIDQIRSVLRKMQARFESRQMKCIRALCKNYPPAAMIYFEFVTSNIFRLEPLGQAICLELFLLCMPNLSVDVILKELTHIKFEDFLRNRVLLCEKIALQIIDFLVTVLSPLKILPLAKIVIPYMKHELAEYRKITYTIFINIYKKYTIDNSGEEEVRDLMSISKEVLLNGVLDPTEKLHEMILDFWTQDAQLTNTCKERLLEILRIYTFDIGQKFLPFILLLMLDLTKKSSDYTKKMFHPLHDCCYRDYKITISWRTKNLSSKAPLFAPSLASQMNQVFTQTSATLPSIYSDFTYTRPVYDSNAKLQLQATQEPEFEPTYANENSLATYSALEEQDDTFKVPKVPQPGYHKRSARFLSSSTDVSAAIRQKEIKKNIWHEKMIKEEAARQRSTAKLYRSYRIGDFPDIEISHAALIEPLQQLAKNDQMICKDLTVSIICSLIEDSRRDSFVEQLADHIKRIVENEEGRNSTISAVLEILLKTRITNCSSEAIARASRANGLNFLGSLVLEENLIYGADLPKLSAKRIRMEIPSDSCSKWFHLANLYESMNDVDVVLSIFQNHITNEDMQIASFAHVNNDWELARQAYAKAYQTESELVREQSLQKLLECLSNLNNWDEIERHIKRKLNNNINNVWNDPWKGWMLPWMLEVYARKLLAEDHSEQFTDDVNEMHVWLKDPEKLKYVKRNYGNELSLFFISNYVETARDFIFNTLDETRQQWINLHPLSTQIKVRMMQNLRITNDLNAFLQTKKTVTPFKINKLMKFWNNSMPSPHDAIIPWDKLTSYKEYFIETLLSEALERLNERATQSDSISVNIENEGIQTMQDTLFNVRLKMIETAFNQENKYMAKKFAKQLEKNKAKYLPKLQHQFRLVCAKVLFLSGKTETNIRNRLVKYTSSWNHCCALLRSDDIDDVTNVNVRQQLCALAATLIGSSEADKEFARLLTVNDTIIQDLNTENFDTSDVIKALDNYNFKQLKMCCDMTTTSINECYLNLAKYCYNRITNCNAIDLSKEFIHCILKGMSYGSREAAHFFPCLLKPEYFTDQEVKDIFFKESGNVQTWMFLSWQAQLFSHLGTSIAPLVIPILKRIVDTYPNAVIYTLRLAVETNPALLNETSTYEIRQLLYNRPEIDRFMTAMQYVVQPELYLQYYLCQFKKNLSLGTATALDLFLKNVYLNLRGDLKPGSIFNEIASYKSKIQELGNKKPDEIRLQVDKIIESIKLSLRKRKDKLKLQDYSPWLCSFPERDIEIPGQFTGNRKPMPQYHTKIVKFDRTVKVMQSIRKPIRITMIGNDAKEYHFLTKFGEDLRQDQRLQQLFGIMNKALHIHTACRQRQLSIDTYQVIPLSKTVGLIQWIDNTRSLQDLINFTLSEQERKRYDSLLGMYEEWMRSAAPSKKQHEYYKEAVLKYSATKVIAKMNELVDKTQWDSLRKTLTVLCPSVESFVTMRRNFITSYATMCIAHWILGIGDRHLQNTLITIDSGRCLGIDFGLAFDAGVCQRIPELMPFRLTPQILGLLKPFTEKDLFGTTMAHVLQAVRNEQGPILSCMDVFVHEPLNWTEHINKALKENDEDITDVKWVPKKKIRAVTHKLNGIKPTLITLEQLKEQHNDDKYADKYYNIIMGDDEIKRPRVKLKSNHLTAKEQVECLLDQATDFNILARTFVGWKPWL